MATTPRAPAVDKRAFLRIQADLRRLKIIRTNQGKLVTQMQDLVARYNKSEALARDMQKKVDETIAGIAVCATTNHSMKPVGISRSLSGSPRKMSSTVSLSRNSGLSRTRFRA